MEARRFPFLLLYVALLCMMLVGSSLSIRRITESFLSGNGVNGDNQDTEEDLADQVWVYCRKEYLRAVEDFNLHTLKASTDVSRITKLDLALLMKSIQYNAILSLPHQEKLTLLDCLEKNDVHLLFHDSLEESGLKTWFLKSQEFLFGWLAVPRRITLSKTHGGQSAKYASAPDLSSTKAVFINSPALSSLLPATTSSDTFQPAVVVPEISSQ